MSSTRLYPPDIFVFGIPSKTASFTVSGNQILLPGKPGQTGREEESDTFLSSWSGNQIIVVRIGKGMGEIGVRCLRLMINSTGSPAKVRDTEGEDEYVESQRCQLR